MFWIFLACFLHSALCLRCPDNTKKVTLKVFVEHHQQSLTSAASYVKSISSSSSYRSEYNSIDTSASVSGSYGGFSAAASASFSEVNSLVTSRSDYNHREAGKERKFNPLDLQIVREVTTTVIIDGKSSKVFEKRFVNSAPIEARWSGEKLHEESVKFLRNKFYGEGNKIRGTTYTSETCKGTKKTKNDFVSSLIEVSRRYSPFAHDKS